MKGETVADIAAEDEDTRSKRAYLDQKVADLRKAHNDCLEITMKNRQKTV